MNKLVLNPKNAIDRFGFERAMLVILHYEKYMYVFGMTLTDDKRTIGGSYKAHRDSKVPEKLTCIEVSFRKNEDFLHSLRFIGETRVRIGAADGKYTNDDYKAGRVETVTFEPGEGLIGCEIHHSE